MTIHRTRQGSVPSGGPEAGRQIIQIGDFFVEYSGAAPDQAELDAHLNPLKVIPPGLLDTPASVVSVPGLRAPVNALKALFRQERGLE